MCGDLQHNMNVDMCLNMYVDLHELTHGKIFENMHVVLRVNTHGNMHA